MTDFFAAETPPPPPRRGAPSRGRRPLVFTLVALAAIVIAFSGFAGFWTERLWFQTLGYSNVWSTMLLTRIGLFFAFGLLMALIVGINLYLAYRIRPAFIAPGPDQANLERYRALIGTARRRILLGVVVVLGIFGGTTAAGQWRTWLMWRNGTSFGDTDPYFDKDQGFYVFTLPWMHFLVDFVMSALIIALLGALMIHYLFGGIRLQARTGKVSSGVLVHASLLGGLLLLAKAADYYLDRFDLTSASGGLITGMTYTRDNAILPGKTILMFIAVVCALILFANVFRRSWLLPSTGLALFVLSAVLLGALWPGIMQRFQVRPDEPDKEEPYIAANIEATRKAYGLDGAEVTPYAAKTTLSPQQLAADAASLPGIRLVDPILVSETYEQEQQLRGYYSFPPVLDVDNYQINGEERDLVLAAREMNVDGLPAEQQNWANLHTVYTHGYGIVAAYGNQRDKEGNPVGSQSDRLWAERDIPPRGELSGEDGDGYRPQIYFGESSPEYSIVGRKPGGNDVELDYPEGDGEGGAAQTTTYDGEGGVGVGSLWRKLLYAVKFSEPNFLLSSRVHENSSVLYERSPRERVQKVAPWLTIDADPFPAVVDGKVVWILDGYTTTDRFPQSQKRSMQEMTSDAINPRSAYATLPTDNINYIRNSVKATVDAYDGTVTLYAWEEDEPILKAWQSAFPGTVKPRSEVPEALLDHFRYPQDQFKVQRNMLAEYHVTNAKAFYEGSDKWQVPEDPNTSSRTQPPYRLSVATKSGDKPTFSLTSVYTPRNKQNLASFISVGADAADESTYGKFQILRLPDSTQVPGPSQIANQFNSDDKIANALLPFKRAGTQVVSGNLLTLPVGDGLLYVQPVYTLREGGSGNYPVLRFVLASFGDTVGIGSTLQAALDDVIGETGGTPSGPEPSPDPAPEPAPDDEPGGGELPVEAIRLLQQADAKFREADQALREGSLSEYERLTNEGKALVRRALNQ